MIKYLFILSNSLILFICSLFSGDTGVSISGNFPASVTAGQDIPIEILIKRGDVTGFGAFELTLPDGLSVTENDEKTAVFNISNGVAKWEWSELPDQEEISIKFVLNAWANASGTKVVQAKFNYIVDNDKKFSEMQPAEITINAAPVLSTDRTDAPAPDSTVKRGANAEPAGKIEVTRTISKSEQPNEYLITLKIQKGITKGFARYSDELPAEFTAKAVKTDGSSFSVADGKLKFVWVSVPDKSELEISYHITGPVPSKLPIYGEYSYLEDNQSKKVTLEKDELVFGTGVVEGGKEEPVVKNENNDKDEPVLEKKGIIERIKSKLKGDKDGSANYRVQIGAFGNAAVTSSTLKRRFKVNEEIKTESLDGLSKFMIGSHSLYKSAREQREQMIAQNGIKSAFVVAYNQGKRITVQEALMITSQKWFK